MVLNGVNVQSLGYIHITNSAQQIPHQHFILLSLYTPLSVKATAGSECPTAQCQADCFKRQVLSRVLPLFLTIITCSRGSFLVPAC
ncbi:hypothetical protein E2C01_050215 [Portunus trituberculatus]|uniref:Uncharacterized protein n=1 Tax=Portunus trituberculatus TaxID=210409 RepID=A0A5B7GBG8_PORTR|nr:hypothetical protein [Portunus trituberculatus]